MPKPRPHTEPPRTREDALELSELAALDLADLVEDPEQKGILLSEATLSGDAVPELDVEASSFVRVSVRDQTARVRLDGVDLVECDFANADLTESWWYDVVALDCRLTGSALTKVKLGRITFDRCAMSLISFEDATLERVRFVGCDLRGVDLSGANLSDVRFEDCELDEFVTIGTSFERVDFTSSELGRDIDVAGLRGATIDGDQLLKIALQLARKHGIEIAESDPEP